MGNFQKSVFILRQTFKDNFLIYINTPLIAVHTIAFQTLDDVFFEEKACIKSNFFTSSSSLTLVV